MTNFAVRVRLVRAMLATCLAVAFVPTERASAQTFLTLNTGSSVSWNTTLWSPGGLPPQTATEVGLLQGGGTMTIDAASTNTTPDGLLIGWGGNFNVRVTGGTLTTGTSTGDARGNYGLSVGESNGVGTLTQTGGLVTAPLVSLGRVNGNGTYTLSGGTLSTTQIVKGPGAATLNLNGGTIRVSGTSATLISSTVTTSVQSGGAVFDTAGFDTTVAAVLSGSGGLVKAGAGRLMLTATNTYTGGNVIAGGTLQIGNNTALALPSLGGYTLQNGSTLVFSLDVGNNSLGTATISGTGNVVFAGLSTANSYYTGNKFAAGGLTYTGTTTINFENAANYYYVERNAFPSTTILNVLQGGIVLRQNQTVAGLSGTSGNIGAGFGAQTLTINIADGASYTSAASVINNGGATAVTKSGGGVQILTGSSTYTGATTITGGTLQIGEGGTSGSITSNVSVSSGAALAFNRSDSTTYANAISGSGSLVQLGTGTLALSASNSFTGSARAVAGTLSLGNVNALAGATLDLNGSDAGTVAFTLSGSTYNIAGLTGSRNLASDSRLSIGANGQSTAYAGTFSGSGGLTKVGSGTLALTGNNVYSGTTTISAGSLRVGDGSTNGSLPGTAIVNNGMLISDRSDFVTFAGPISGSGSLRQEGSGTAALSGSNSFTGSARAVAGTLSLGNVNALVGATLDLNGSDTGTVAFTLSGSTYNIAGLTGSRNLASNSTLSIGANNQSATYSGTFSGSGGLTKVGSGTLTLTANNVYSGSTTINGGAIQVGNGSTTGAVSGGSISIASGASLVFNRSDNISHAGSVVSGAGALTKLGAGTLLLSASNTLTGLTTVSQGVLQSGSTAAATTTINGGNYALAEAAKLVFARNIDDVRFTTQSISGAGDVEFQGQADGYFTFRAAQYSGTLSYTGQTIVNLTGTATGGNAYRGALWLEKDNVLPNATVLNLQSGKVYTRNQTASGISIAGITGSAGTFITTDATGGTQKWTVTVASGSSYTYAGVLGYGGWTSISAANGNNMSFTKAGAGTQIFTGVNTYTGATTITGGRLEIASGGRINGTSGITINGSGAELKYNSATALMQPITFTQGTISGTGTIGTAVTVATNDILAPGNSPGAQAYSAGLTWSPGGTYQWEINDALGVAGLNWDILNVSGGALNLSGLSSENRFILDLITLTGTAAGPMANYVDGQSYTFPLASYTALTLPTGFSGNDLTSLFTLAFTSWNNPTPSLSNVSVVNNTAAGTIDLVIVPEPSALVLAGIAVAVAGWSLRTRRLAT